MYIYVFIRLYEFSLRNSCVHSQLTSLGSLPGQVGTYLQVKLIEIYVKYVWFSKKFIPYFKCLTVTKNTRNQTCTFREYAATFRAASCCRPKFNLISRS